MKIIFIFKILLPTLKNLQPVSTPFFIIAQPIVMPLQNKKTGKKKSASPNPARLPEQEPINKHALLLRWMKSEEVMKFLGVQRTRLYNMRMDGSLPYSQLGARTYYDSDDLHIILLKNKRRGKI